ncbi:hypothetical protein [Sedimenticola hydrogenitrophicus]|uniref:hypothetical protein n=1 Tax=Sedimenticola hydrogenitrophicus TaxID=2967975 RepID=UPI0023AFEAA6|nr:hypothetical protein [Sedimenticola hydrogenitrophicus]
MGQSQLKSCSLRHTRIAQQRQRDPGVNLSGAALVLELLDRVAEFDARLRDLPR